MDLYAYSQIEDLGKIADANGIDIPRCRGYRLMSEETPITEEEIERLARRSYRETKQLCTPTSHWHIVGIDNRREIKGKARHYAKLTRKQLHAFNKYAGKEGILMVHARIGGANWRYYGGPLLAMKPWFIEKVDDGADDTYCDIYVRIKTMDDQIKEIVERHKETLDMLAEDD